MVLFVGNEETGYFVSELLPEVKYTGYQPDITKIADGLLQESYEYIIFNVEQFMNDFTVIAGTIKRIQTASNVKIIIFASGYTPQSEMIQALIAEGFTFFILSASLGAIKKDLSRCIRGESTVMLTASPSDQPEPPTVIQPSRMAAPPAHHYTTVSFAGCLPRMGTTTQAIQFIKYLQLQGYKACYIEVNNSGYVQRLQSLYSVAGHSPDIGCVSYQNVELYYNKSRISEILKLGYDYYIYDFGNFTEPDFDPAFFLEKNIPVAVMGSSPNEFDSMELVIRQTIDSDIFYIFNFADEAEQPDILELMEKKAGNTVFGGYAPDPFLYLSDRNRIYSRIVAGQNPAAPEKRPKPKSGLFRRRQRV